MTWHTIPTLSALYVPSAADLNLYLDNLNHLHTPNVDSYEETSEGANITTTSTDFAAVSASFQLSLTTVGERVLIYAAVVSSLAAFDIRIDGTRMGGGASLTGSGTFGQMTGTSIQLPHRLIRILNLSAGAHTFDLEWKAISGTATIYTRFRPRFMVRSLKI